MIDAMMELKGFLDPTDGIPDVHRQNPILDI
jgi:hypothetical protein